MIDAQVTEHRSRVIEPSNLSETTTSTRLGYAEARSAQRERACLRRYRHLESPGTLLFAAFGLRDICMPATDQTHDGINVPNLLATLRRQRVVIILSALVGAGLFFAYSSSQAKQYSATASLLFRDPAFDQRLFGTTVTSRSDPDRDAATNIALVSKREVAEQTARSLGPGWTADRVANRVVPSSVSRSDVVDVTAVDGAADVAARVANAYARSFVDIRKVADQRQIRGAQLLVQRQLAAVPPDERAGQVATSLTRQGQQLGVLASLQTGKVEVVQAAEVPEGASGPRIKRDTALGLILGLGIGLALAYLRTKLDRRVREPEEIEAMLGRPTLGMIPDVGTSASADGQRASIAVDAFQSLRTNLRFFNPSGKVQTILVTSASPGDGKSLVSRNLAFAAAEAGLRTLLIEADLRRPTLAAALSMPAGHGLSSVLVRQSTLAEAVQVVSLDRSPRSGSNGTSLSLHVIPAGPLPPNPSDLLGSVEMSELLTECEQLYDFVVVDTAPVLVVTDAVPLLKRDIGLLIVARLGRTDREALLRLNRYLALLEAPVMGVVVNWVKLSSSAGYGYGADTAPSQAVPAEESAAATVTSGLR